MALDSRVSDYFARPDTVAAWWTPDEGPLAFHYDAELRILDDHLPYAEGWEVLDVGTGRGRFGVHFAGKGCRVTGLDLNPDMLEIARQTAAARGVADRFEILPGNAEDLSAFPDASFDVVSCMELFDHLPRLDRALAEMRRVLRPGGHFVFTYVPSESLYGAIGNGYRALRRRYAKQELMISRTYALTEVTRALVGQGLAIERYFGIGVLCVNAQTRLFGRNPIVRLLTAIARAESRVNPYYARPALARRGAHVVGIARPAERSAP